MKTRIYTLTSPLHNEAAVASASEEFLSSIDISHELAGGDFSSYSHDALNLIFVRTGGTEGLFREVFDIVRDRPVYLLTSGKSNSLAASMEILSFLHQNGVQGEIIHGSAQYIHERISSLQKVFSAREKLSGMRLGVIGRPSDWLISSGADYEAVRRKTGITLVDIPIERLVSQIEAQASCEDVVDDAMRIYAALKHIVEKERLSGLTVRCFDLLDKVHNTGCLALAKLNAEGIVAGCEGDVPAMLSMALCSAATGISGFQANPASVDIEASEMVFAHCTIPLNMVTSYSFTTHFESGIGVGIHGEMPLGEATVFKVSGDLSRVFSRNAYLSRNQYKKDLCRTQVAIRFAGNDRKEVIEDYFLKNPIGNHHIILPGHHAELLSAILQQDQYNHK